MSSEVQVLFVSESVTVQLAKMALLLKPMVVICCAQLMNSSGLKS